MWQSDLHSSAVVNFWAHLESYKISNLFCILKMFRKKKFSCVYVNNNVQSVGWEAHPYLIKTHHTSSFLAKNKPKNVNWKLCATISNTGSYSVINAHIYNTKMQFVWHVRNIKTNSRHPLSLNTELYSYVIFLIYWCNKNDQCWTSVI